MNGIRATLSQFGENRRTSAIFMSDNGMLWGEHGLSGKWRPYSASLRVPLLMRWPGHFARGLTDTRLAANVDLAPTIVDAARLPESLKLSMDGHSLLTETRRPRILLENLRGRLGRWAALRTRSYQYTEYYTDGQVSFREYYDLRRDPWQLTNLLKDGDPENDPELGRLESQLASDRVCAASSCP